MARSPERRRKLLLGALALALALPLAWRRAQAPSAPAPAPHGSPEEPAPPPPRDPASATHSAPSRPAPQASPPPGALVADASALALPAATLDPELRVGSTVEGASVSALRAAAARRDQDNARFYRFQSEFPAWTQPLPAGRDPVLEGARPRSAGAGTTEGQQLRVDFSDWALTPGRELVVTARMTGPEGTAPLRAARARVLDTHRAELLAGFDLVAQPDGSLVGRWTVPDASLVAEDPGLHSIEVSATTSGGLTLHAASVLNIAATTLASQHRYRDELSDGSLVVYALLRAESATRVHLSGTLARAGAEDGPRVLAQSAVQVEPGERWVPLRFYGRAVRALGDGPYVLTALQAQDAGQFPPARLPLERDAHRTQPYAASSFDDRPYNDPTLNDLAAFSEGAAP